MPELQQEGTFRVRIIEYAVQESKESAIGVYLKAEILEAWNPATASYDKWTSTERYTIDGVLWVLKKDGTPNEKAIKSLVDNAGWDAKLSSVDNKTWKPWPCSVSVGSEEYKGNVRYKIGFVNPWEYTKRDPTVTGERVHQLDLKFGDALSKFASTTAKPPVIAEEPAKDEAKGEDIPF